MAQGTTREWETEIEPDGQGHFEPGQPMEVPADNTQAVVGSMMEAATLLKRVGGVVSMAARRVEVAPGIYRTRSIVAKWDSFGGPAERAAQDEKPADE